MSGKGFPQLFVGIVIGMLLLIVVVGAVFILQKGGIEPNTSIHIDATQVPNLGNMITTEEVHGWTLEEVYLEEENATEQTSSIPQTINACAQAQTVTKSCTETTQDSFQFSTELETSLGVDQTQIALSPAIQRQFSISRSAQEGRSWTTQYGYIEVVNVTIHSVYTPGKGSFVDDLGNTIKGDLVYYTGDCIVTIERVSITECEVTGQPVMHPTPMPTNMPSVVPVSPVVQSTVPRYAREDEIIHQKQVEISVKEGEIHVLTLGPGTIEGKALKVGDTHGNVIILLPRERPYKLTGLSAGYVWHGIFVADDNLWRSLAERYDAEMRLPEKCGNDCETVDVIVVSATGFLSYP